MPWIKLISGAALGFDTPTHCHSTRKCGKHTKQPGRDGWKLLATDFNFKAEGATVRGRAYDANGWWCPACASELVTIIRQTAIKVTSEDIPLMPPNKSNTP